MNELGRYTLGTLSLLALGLSGCANDEPTEEDYDDVAAAMSQMVSNESGGEVGSMEDAVELATGAATDLSAMGSGAYQGTYLGLQYEYAITCKDAGGSTQAACDDTTDSANLVVDWSGELDLPRYDATVDRTGNWTLSGIQSDLVKFDGQGTFDIDTEFTALLSNRKRTFNLDYDAQYDNVTWDRNLGTLVDGTIHYDVKAERTRERKGKDVEASFDMMVVVTFDGSGSASIVIDGDHSYQVNLGSGELTKQ